ncbi:MAG: hypothetical protein AABW86_03060 [Candidatus Micrarchaeota archaeon]
MSEKVRTTLVLEESVFQKLKQESDNNMSEFVNRILKKELFETRKSMFGALKGKISAKDMVEDED